jgi:hydrogenase-1 operon protein HyaF
MRQDLSGDSDRTPATIDLTSASAFGRSAHAPTSSGVHAALASLDGVKLARECPNAIALLSEVGAALKAQAADAPTRTFRLDGLNDLEHTLIADVCGAGEVSGIVALPGGAVAQIQESVLAGLWRIHLDGDTAEEAKQYLEVGPIPELVRLAARDLTEPEISIDVAPEGAMNVMPVLAEIRDHAATWRTGMPSRIINFTLLPMNEADMTFLQQSLRNGPIQLLSRGHGSCRILATGIRNVWSVQYMNASDVVILDTLEVGGVPTAAIAATEDFEDSAERLTEILEVYFR